MPDYGLGEAVRKKNIICICPKCRGEYRRSVYWSGNGTPRIYCDDCREALRAFWALNDWAEFSTDIHSLCSSGPLR